MKLSTLYEARNPELEKELEPLLAAPFRDYGPRRKDEPDLNKFPVQNTTNTGTTLLKAISYWRKNYNGQRWPALEQAFLNRAWTFKGKTGSYNSARLSLFDYLNNLNEPWPEGDHLANQLLSSNGALAYYNKPAIMHYLTSRPRIQGFADSIEKSHTDAMKAKEKYSTVDVPKYEQDYKKYEEKLAAWQAEQNKKPTEFHDNDEFGGNRPYPPNKPWEPRWLYDDDEFINKYRKPDWKPEPKPNPNEAQEFAEKLKKIEERPPFAGWA